MTSTTCACGEPSPPVKATLANGETVLIHPLVDRECGDMGIGGSICLKPILVVKGQALPLTTNFVGKP